MTVMGKTVAVSRVVRNENNRGEADASPGINNNCDIGRLKEGCETEYKNLKLFRRECDTPRRCTNVVEEHNTVPPSYCPLELPAVLHRLSSLHIMVISVILLNLAISLTDGCYVFPPDKVDPCLNMKCYYGAECVSSSDGSAGRCQCPTECNSYGDSYGSKPVCGNDGQNYNNWCELRMAACEQMKEIKIKSYGKCDPCDGQTCDKNQVCRLDVDGKPTCGCEESCESRVSPVCGSDGHTYSNECLLKQAACNTGRDIKVLYNENCKGPEENQRLCEGYPCQFDQDCVVRNGRPICECPVCKDQYDPVCGNNGLPYENECRMRLENCMELKNTRVEHRGLCSPIDCDKNKTVCQFYSVCQTEDNISRCVCPTNCEQTGMKICGSDGVTYDSECELRVASCRKGRKLWITSYEECDDCNGEKCKFGARCENNRCVCPEVCPIQDSPVCASDERTYKTACHMQKEACRRSVELVVVRSGECDDIGGSGDQCGCHPTGSIGNSCNSTTKQCHCKPGVAGLKCDACYPGYWGIHLLHANGNYGCMKCGCHEIGSRRMDCQQNIGKCLCKEGYDGLKCNRCKSNGAEAGPGGCYVDRFLTPRPTASPSTQRSRKTTRHLHIQTSSYLNSIAPKHTKSTHRPPTGYIGRIGDFCLDTDDGMVCLIPNSHCRLMLCKCNTGYIPTMGNTKCSKVAEETTVEVPDTCSLKPCQNNGECILDDELGYRCLCYLGRTGTICSKRSSFQTPSFTGTSYLTLEPLGFITDEFYLDISFHTMNWDGILLYGSQNQDGTGQYMSLAITNGHIEFKFDMGSGPVIINHPFTVSQESFHQVVVKKLSNQAILIIDNTEPVEVVSFSPQTNMDLSGKLYLGFLPQNLTFIKERIGVNWGFVGCIRSLTAGNLDRARVFNLEYPNPSTNIVGGLDIVPCETNLCQSIPCQNGGTCTMLNNEIYHCMCLEGFTGSDCEAPLDICSHSPCHPSATCSLSDTGEIICHCPEDREGQFCEYEKLAALVTPQFSGSSYMILPIQEVMAHQLMIEVWFSTLTRNGVLMYSSQYLGGLGDFISLKIVDLYPEFRFDLGDGVVVLTGNVPVEIDHWHKLVVRRLNKDASMTLDDVDTVKNSSKGILSELQLYGTLFVGGYKDSFDRPLSANITHNFTGTIQRIYINGHLIENPYDVATETHNVAVYDGPPCNLNPCLNGGVCVPKLDNAECRCTQRYTGKICQQKIADNSEKNPPVRFDSQLFLQFYNELISRQQAQKSNKFQFRLRTHQTSGLLVYQSQGPSIKGDYLAIAISGGQIELSYNLGKQSSSNLLIIRSTVHISDGQWHTVYAERNRREGKLQVDKEPIVTASSEPMATQLDTDGLLWIGGRDDLPSGLPPDYKRGFKGCLGDVFVNDRELILLESKNELRNTLDLCH